jgi:hypothetical protein
MSNSWSQRKARPMTKTADINERLLEDLPVIRTGVAAVVRGASLRTDLPG